ncbi:MAG: substrate-binding domain-containing protein [Oscillospiraceae bacterium]
MENLHMTAQDYGFKLLCFQALDFNTFKEDHYSIGEMNIFNLINYDMLDAMIILCSTLSASPVMQTIIRNSQLAGIPVVCYDANTESCINISFEQGTATYDMVDHFITKHHHDRLCFMTSWLGEVYGDQRLKAYQQALADHGIAYDETRVFEGLYSRETAIEQTQKILALDPLPQAIICANDTMAIGVIKVLNDHGMRCPEDICVSGFDGIIEGRNHIPQLTTVIPNFAEGARNAIALLNDYFTTGECAQLRAFSSYINYSESCGCRTLPPRSFNDLCHSLYYEVDNMKVNSRHLIQSSATITGSPDMQTAFARLREEISSSWTKKLWVCITENFFAESSFVNGTVKSGQYYINGFSDNMRVIAFKHYDTCTDGAEFPTKTMLPDLFSQFDDTSFITFLPLHIGEHTIGYMAFEISDHFDLFDYWYSLSMNIASSLSILKTQYELRNFIAHSGEYVYP